jgi:hypothetical protein
MSPNVEPSTIDEPCQAMLHGETGQALGRPGGDIVKRSHHAPPVIDKAQQAAYQAKPLNTKGEHLRNMWADVAYNVLCQAEKFSRSVSKKDYGRLMQLLSSAGIAYDKVVPKGIQVSNNLQFNLFTGLQHDRVSAVLGNADQKPCTVNHVSENT